MKVLLLLCTLCICCFPFEIIPPDQVPEFIEDGAYERWQMEHPRGMANKPERLEWLQDAGFGMFIHFSYDSQLGCVISHTMAGASKPYLEWFLNELPKTFNPDRWDAEKIAILAKLTGMKYVVLTAKHCNGFCFWDTQTTDLKITNTPYRKDLLYDYVRALRRHGIAVGIYYSPEDFSWLHRNGHRVRRTKAVGSKDLIAPERNQEYSDFIRAQVRELFTNYGPIDVFFIDANGKVPAKEVAWSLQPDCLITRGAIVTPEQFVPGRPPEGPWETCLTMGTQWAYKPTNDDYKSGTRLIEILIETRAKGGSLLLNVGPKPDGELPIEQEERLREVALWHAANGESIHETRPWVVANEEDIWFTKKKDENTVYAFLTRRADWVRGTRKTVTLHSVRATPSTKIGVLGQDDEIVEYQPTNDPTPTVEQTADGLKLSVVRAQRLYNNNKWPNPIVVKLENVGPAFEAPPYAETVGAKASRGGRAVVEGRLVEMCGAKEVEVGIEYQVYGGFAEAMYNTDWTRSATKTMTATGPFKIEIKGLRPETVYQCRVFVKHSKITMRGDHIRVTTE